MASSNRTIRKGKPEGVALRRDGKDGPQMVSTGRTYWSKEAERRFLNSLAATCNVRLSAAEAGFGVVTVYNHRRNDPAFAERWQAALEQGYVRIETALVRAAGDAMEGFAPDPETPIPSMSATEAMALLRFHRDAVERGRFGRGRRPPPRPLSELSEGILAKLAAMDAFRGRE